jgi:orotate phosphoribosyltransferase
MHRWWSELDIIIVIGTAIGGIITATATTDKV